MDEQKPMMDLGDGRKMEISPLLDLKKIKGKINWFKIVVIVLLVINFFQLSAAKKMAQSAYDSAADAAEYSYRAMNSASDAYSEASDANSNAQEAASYASDAADAASEARDYAEYCS